MPGVGSTAITRAPRPASRRVAMPVPAPTSSTFAPFSGRPVRRSSSSKSSSGYEGRARSYSAATEPNDDANS